MERRLSYILIIFLILSAGTCQKEDAGCHKSFFVENNSQETVIIALRLRKVSTRLCKLNGNTYAPGQHFELDLLRTCWEDELSGDKKQIVYVVDTANYNDPNEFYPCDSIASRNNILRKYELSLEDLQANDFRISYP